MSKRDYINKKNKFYILRTFNYNGQFDSPESPETPEITEMMENFTKVTKYLTKLKETLINYVWENLTSKTSKDKNFHGFHIFDYALW